MSTLALDALFLEEKSVYNTTKSLIEDVIILSCAAFRMMRDHGQHYSITTDALASLVTAADKELSEKIIRHYKKQLAMGALRDDKETNYIKDLKVLLTMPVRRTIDEKFIGMAYFLPYFFEYDNTVSDILRETKITPLDAYRTIIKHVSFVLVKRLLKRKSGKVIYEYWFKDLATDEIFAYSLRKDNSLYHMFDRLAHSGKFDCYADYKIAKHFDDRSYYRINSIK
jgi:hypothetical protein